MSERQRNRRILIAEDHVGVRSVMARLLQFEGYEVHEARHGLDVLAILARDQLPDLLLLDLSMPRLDGQLVMKALHRHHPELPVILVTAMMCSAEYTAHLGARGFLSKPFTTGELLAVIQHVLTDSKVDVA